MNLIKTALPILFFPLLALGQGDRSHDQEDHDTELHRLEMNQESVQKIRQELRDDSTLSPNAQQILITASNGGQVTLMGVVGSESEKKAIETDASRIVGPNNIVNRIAVTSPTNNF